MIPAMKHTKEAFLALVLQTVLRLPARSRRQPTMDVIVDGIRENEINQPTSLFWPEFRENVVELPPLPTT